MEIEVGERYIRADGFIVIIIETKEIGDYCYIDNMKTTYAKTGTYFTNGISYRDLICEIVPSIYALYKGGIIHIKELIKQHIEYYTK